VVGWPSERLNPTRERRAHMTDCGFGETALDVRRGRKRRIRG
jgi:hypothetical protein